MRKPSSSNPSEDPSDPLDPDWAPQIPSIWDMDEDDGDDAERGIAAAPPWPIANDILAWPDPAAWIRAEGAAGRALAEATAAVVRLDERLLGMDADARKGARLRIALEAVPELLWSEGVRLRPEYLALAGVDRLGGGDDAPLLARAAWAVRRMTATAGLDTSAVGPKEMRAFLGLREPGSATDGADSSQEDDFQVLGLPEPHRVEPEALDEWCAVVSALGEAHPLTRAVAGGALWAGLGVTDAAYLVEPAMVMGVLGAAAGQGGVIAAPVGRLRPGSGGEVLTRLEAGLDRIAEGARTALMQLGLVAAWQGRAIRVTDGLKGKGPVALIALFSARPVVSARDIATALDLTDRHARRLVDKFAELGLVRELTGHGRFRYWAARL